MLEVIKEKWTEYRKWFKPLNPHVKVWLIIMIGSACSGAFTLLTWLMGIYVLIPVFFIWIYVMLYLTVVE
jgi:hypothetical protein